MGEQQQNAQLNQLLVKLQRSLLQYVGESWPWAEAENSEELQALREAVELQQQGVARLAELLNHRRWSIDFGVYPVEFTDLHYVASSYLLSQLVESEKSLVDDMENDVASLSNDSAGGQIFAQIIDDQREIVSRLQRLVQARTSQVSA
jgi:hypothetical protein